MTDEEDLLLAAAIVRLERWRFDYSRKMTPLRIATIEIPQDYELKQWVRARLTTARTAFGSILKALSVDESTDGHAHDPPSSATFHELAQAWKEETALEASMAKKAMHPAYQRIIGMGPAAIPLILDDLRRTSDHWFWALRATTGENPVTSDHRGHVRFMVEDWLRWAKEHGYLDGSDER